MNTKYLEIIKAPVVTEKAAYQGQEGIYQFYVDPKANKTEIKLAIEKIFGVKVEDIRTVNVHPKKRRVGKYTGMTNKYKRAVVKLAEGNSINFD